METREANAKSEGRREREREGRIGYLPFKESICQVNGKCKKQFSIPDCFEWRTVGIGQGARGDGFVGCEEEESHANLCADHTTQPWTKEAAAVQTRVRSGQPDKLESKSRAQLHMKHLTLRFPSPWGLPAMA